MVAAVVDRKKLVAAVLAVGLGRSVVAVAAVRM